MNPALERHPLRSHGHAPALEEGGRTLSYRELAREAGAVARRLREAGLVPGGVVALRGPLDGGMVTALHGVWEAGGVAAPLNPRWTPREEEEALELLAPRFVLAAQELASRDGPAVAGPGGRRPGSGRSAAGRPATHRPGADRPAALLLTSGSSGRPRAVTLTFGNLLASARGVTERLSLLPSDRWLASLSPSHVGGLALVFRAGLTGSSLVLTGGWSPERLVELAVAGKVTHASLVPTMLHQLLEVWGTRPAPRGLRCLLVGGAPAPPPLLEGALERGFPLALTYGLTEASSQVATAPPALVRRKPGTVGEPLPGVRVRLGPGGEILARGATVAPGAAGEDGWLPTGDLARVDGEGHLWIEGRLSDRILSGGVTVDPAGVEAALRALPGVREVAVVGLPDEKWGERVVAAVVPLPGHPLGEGALEEEARSALSPAKRPRTFLFLERLPRNANGKVDREAVRGLFRS